MSIRKRFPTTSEIWKFSNPSTVQVKADKYLKTNNPIYKSTRKDKKYMIYDRKNDKWVHFGAMGYEDFTKHRDVKRRNNYRKRATNISGDWRKNKYSPNNLAIHLLW